METMFDERKNYDWHYYENRSDKYEEHEKVTWSFVRHYLSSIEHVSDRKIPPKHNDSIVDREKFISYHLWTALPMKLINLSLTFGFDIIVQIQTFPPGVTRLSTIERRLIELIIRLDLGVVHLKKERNSQLNKKKKNDKRQRLMKRNKTNRWSLPLLLYSRLLFSSQLHHDNSSCPIIGQHQRTPSIVKLAGRRNGVEKGFSSSIRFDIK